MTRLLVAGAGLIGRRHITHILEHPELQLAGVIDPIKENRRIADVPGFADINDVDIAADGIVIATPTQTHEKTFAEAARRGWSALIEKPIAHSLDAADRMIAVAEDAGVQILIGHHRRFHPRVRRLADLINTRIGQPVLASMIWAVKKPDDYFNIDWRQGADGAPIRMNICHEIDLLQFLFGEVTGVAGLGANPVRRKNRVESGGIVLSFDSGLIASIAFADTTPSPWGFEHGTGENPNIATTGEANLRIVGTKGGIEFPSLRTWEGATDWSEAPTPREHDAPNAIPLVKQLEHFASVISGDAIPANDARMGRRTLELTIEVEAVTNPERVAL